MSTNGIWADEPGWLKKKRQLATVFNDRFPRYNHQERWLPWRLSTCQTTGWLTIQNHYVAQPLAKAVKQYSELLQENLMEKAMRWQENQLFAAHLSHIDVGQFIYVPDNCQLSVPVRLSPMGMATNPHNVIIVGTNAQVIIEENMRLKSPQPMFAATELLLGNGASVTYRRVDSMRAPLIFSAVHAYQARGAHLSTKLAVINEGEVTISLASFLDGDNSAWDAGALLQPGQYGKQSLYPIVSGHGTASRAHLTSYVDQSTGGKVTVNDFRTNSDKSLSITNKLITKSVGQPAPSEWQSDDPWFNDYLLHYASVTNSDH